MQRPSKSRRKVPDDDIEAVLAACRVLVSLSAQSVVAVEDVADLAQVRALMIVASRGAISLSALAAGAGIHLTRASRMCDRLVAAGLINRVDDPANRRQLTLTLTPRGERVVRKVRERRRALIEPILGGMTKQRAADLVSALRDFAVAGGESEEPHLWAMGWTS